MSLFVVTYTHPNPEGWLRHLPAHLEWLVAGVESGRLRASGDTRQTPIRSALLVIAAPDHGSASAFVATDPICARGARRRDDHHRVESHLRRIQR